MLGIVCIEEVGKLSELFELCVRVELTRLGLLFCDCLTFL